MLEGLKEHLIKGYKSTSLNCVEYVVNAMLAKASKDSQPKASSWTGIKNDSKTKSIHFLSQHSEEAEEEEEIGDAVYMSSFRKSGEDKVKYFDVELKNIISQWREASFGSGQRYNFQIHGSSVASLKFKEE